MQMEGAPLMLAIRYGHCQDAVELHTLAIVEVTLLMLVWRPLTHTGW